MRPRRQIAFLTGRSDPVRWALRPAQRSFLAAVRTEGDVAVGENFPYGATGEHQHRAVPLVVASWRNLYEYAASRRSGFALAHRPAVERLLARAEQTWFIAGSCGLELFNNLALEEAWERRCTLICLGPVARRRPRWAECVVVQGTRDVISRVLFSGGDDVHRARCGHLGYLAEPGVRRICQVLLNPSSPCANISA